KTSSMDSEIASEMNRLKRMISEIGISGRSTRDMYTPVLPGESQRLSKRPRPSVCSSATTTKVSFDSGSILKASFCVEGVVLKYSTRSKREDWLMSIESAVGFTYAGGFLR